MAHRRRRFTYYGKSRWTSSTWLTARHARGDSPGTERREIPINGPERALRRRNRGAAAACWISNPLPDEAAFDDAIAANRSAPGSMPADLDVPAAFPAEWVRQQLLGRFPNLYTGGYEVFTTLRSDPATRRRSARVRKGLLDYDRRHGYRGPGRQSCPSMQTIR